jgi:hypothetical protein
MRDGVEGALRIRFCFEELTMFEQEYIHKRSKRWGEIPVSVSQGQINSLGRSRRNTKTI